MPLLTLSLPSWLEPPFMQRALLALLLIAPALAALGVHVVAFRMAFYAHGVSHSAFSGIAVAMLLSLAPRWGMLAVGLAMALGLVLLSRKSDLSRDVLIGVLLAIMVSFGIVVVSAQKQLLQGFQSALYGDILGIGTGDLVLLAGLFAATIVFESFAFNRLTLIAVHEPMARSHGIHTRLWETLLALWVAVVVLIGLQIIGILMITSLLIVPAAAGRNLARSAAGTFAWSLLISLISAGGGLALSYALDSSTGATVVLVATVLFLLTLPFAPRRVQRT